MVLSSISEETGLSKAQVLNFLDIKVLMDK